DPAALVVERLREIALAFERCRHAEPIDRSARLLRKILVAVEEEQLVVAARPAPRAAERIPPAAALALGLRGTVPLALPAVRVPVRVVLDVVDRPVEPVGSALGDGRNLKAAGAAVLGLVALRQHLDFGNCLDVQ